MNTLIPFTTGLGYAMPHRQSSSLIALRFEVTYEAELPLFCTDDLMNVEVES